MIFRTLRFLQWSLAAIRLLVSLLADTVIGRGTDRDRGRRLRQMFERVGGPAIKVGQQLSVRIDLLPYEICDELSHLQDDAPPFQVSYAIRRIEEGTGKSLEQLFSAFDPAPVGSASIACVYQAVLTTGEKVAVKVRPPAIVRGFLTDMAFMDALFVSAERLSLVPEGFFKHLRAELRQMLMEEQDFEREARYQRLFRQMARKSRLEWLSAPKVFSAYCGADVLVTEFVQGVWCRELIAAMESQDREALDYIASLEISPRKIAKQILYTQFWSSYECLFFHADPHPSNIVIEPGGRLMFLDFGSCGTTSSHMARNQREVLNSLSNNDVAGMVEAATKLLEPLPPLDIQEFKRKIEATYYRLLFALRDRKSPWWERTTMSLWMAMMQATREYKLPINIDVIRQFRCSLLYDTLAYRIHPELSLVRVYERYRRDATERTAKLASHRRERVSPRLWRDRMVNAAGETSEGARRLAGATDNALNELPLRFMAAVDKGTYTAALLLKFLLILSAVGAAAALWFWGTRVFGHPARAESLTKLIPREILHNPEVLTVSAVLTAIVLRRILIRVREQDSQSSRRGAWR